MIRVNLLDVWPWAYFYALPSGRWYCSEIGARRRGPLRKSGYKRLEKLGS